MGATLTVGGSGGGWDQTTDLATWASGQTFTVGDSLVFQYSPLHDVMEVTNADYTACQTSSPLKMYNDGKSTITLSSPGKRYFICGTAGHCSGGMKLEVNTVSAATTTPPSTLPSSPLTPSAATPPKSESPPAADLGHGSSGSSPSQHSSGGHADDFVSKIAIGTGLAMMMVLAL
ncbi:hypothetical protein QJS10_CPA01g01029 [Acorus calamus]|uniref:Phytocyanin domain-containing protein n=1 Tax=Acorus calamus TaxID=4465 RepID=A0AAV9FPA7_ACOCL|nr:hypothetical protein QJS10_CPA01g01029 [Acorus calamus]